MREQRQVVARLDVERGVHPEKVRDTVLITVRIVDKLPAPVMILRYRLWVRINPDNHLIIRVSAFMGRTKCVLNDEYKEKVYFYNFSPCIFIIS